LESPAPITRRVEPQESDGFTARAYAPERRFFSLWGSWLAGGLFLTGFVGGYFGFATGALHLAGLYALLQKLWPALQAPSHATLANVSFQAEGATLHLPDREPLPIAAAETFYECPGCLVVGWQAFGEQVLPERFFTPDEWQRLLALVRANRKPRRATKRLLIEGLALIVAIGLTGFWAWSSRP
jgi:hypothetical protein